MTTTVVVHRNPPATVTAVGGAKGAVVTVKQGPPPTKQYVDSHGVYVSPTPPDDPTQWALWVDTS